MDQIEVALTRGVEKIYPSVDSLRELLNSSRKVSLYCGYDPTSPHLHLGHSATLFKLADFQKLGHRVIFLIGDFTGMIGDPSDKTSTRVKLSREQVLENAKTFKDQAGNILAFESSSNPAEVRFNSEWSDKLTLREVIEMASNFTVQQMIERDMFQNRLREGRPISLHEFLYPLMQGYDSVALDVDLEVGGSDQTFNMLAGRTLMKIIKGREKYVLTTQLLEDEQGRKMSKSEGNFIALDDQPFDMYGKVMSFPDSLIVKTFELCTRVPQEELGDIKRRLESGENPMNLKKLLAKTIVTIYHDSDRALLAEKEFERVVQKGGLPSEVRVVNVPTEEMDLKNLVFQYAHVPSVSEATRVITQGGVVWGDEKIINPDAIIKIDGQKTLRVGKKTFIRPVVKR